VSLDWVLAIIHFLVQSPKYPIPNVWFGMDLGQVFNDLDLRKSCNYVLHKSVPNPFFHEYSSDFGKSSLKLMARGKEAWTIGPHLVPAMMLR
jgi:hypothetical protein